MKKFLFGLASGGAAWGLPETTFETWVMWLFPGDSLAVLMMKVLSGIGYFGLVSILIFSILLFVPMYRNNPNLLVMAFFIKKSATAVIYFLFGVMLVLFVGWLITGSMNAKGSLLFSGTFFLAYVFFWLIASDFLERELEC